MFGGTDRCVTLGVALLLTASFATGCGGGDESTAGDQKSAEKAVAFSAAAESPRVFVNRTAKLLETARRGEDCLEIQDVNNHSYTRFSCPPAKSLSRSMARFKVVGAKEYGTGAVVDYRSGEVADGAAILLFVAPDRKWGISRFGIVTPPSTETSDADNRDDYEKAVDAYLDAVRERDCRAFAATVYVDPRAGDVCKTVFPSTRKLASQLRKDRSPTLKYLGGNGTFGFYSVETEVPVPVLNNVTISVMKPSEGQPAIVLDAAPSVTSEEQARIRRAYRIQQEDARRERERRENRERTTTDRSGSM